ncbi:hypothetical protein TNCV_1884181 [Trichonephila clavipes]|nr:hypothetical protein TNCV_1884181 [Trichonephila clavipes]
MIERVHRHLKASLMCHTDHNSKLLSHLGSCLFTLSPYSKITRHNSSPLQTFAATPLRFRCIHIDFMDHYTLQNRIVIA